MLSSGWKNFEAHNRKSLGTSLAVRWLRLGASTKGVMGSISGRGTRILQAVWPKKEKSLDCLEEIVGRNMEIKGDSGQGLERSKENYREIYHLREYMYYHEQNVGRNINVKGDSGQVSGGNEHDTGDQGKNNPWLKRQELG